MTPAAVADLMATMLPQSTGRVRLLDPGAGVGSLASAAVSHLADLKVRPEVIEVVAYELDPALRPFLDETFKLCADFCEQRGVLFQSHIVIADFLSYAAEALCATGTKLFDIAILNPPYRKVREGSAERAAIRALGLEVSNLYAGFLGAAVRLVRPGGQIVSITPRSFANGTYFRAFRRFLLSEVGLRHLHVFDSRQRAFREDDVLQENVIVHGERGTVVSQVVVSASEGPDAPTRSRLVPMKRVVYDRDPERFIHLILDDEGDVIATRMASLPNVLSDLELEVSTGPVVDFRIPERLREMPGEGTVPLIYPRHFDHGRIRWPIPNGGKPNALYTAGESVRGLTVPRADYVLVRRFSAKEERRRIVAVVIEAKDFTGGALGFENHLNYFHRNGAGLNPAVARGLAVYLNSTIVDDYFRQFSGHTQVNASDLRNIRYPALDQLMKVGERVDDADLGVQERIDALAEDLLLSEGAELSATAGQALRR